jgi:hypothetical protein
MLNGILYWYIFVIIALIAWFVLKRYYLRNRLRLPVLLYHSVTDNSSNANETTIDVNSIESHFKYLLNEGYTPVFLNELIKYVHFGKSLPHKPVLITFDGGYRNNYTLMYPLLKNYGMKVNIFLVPSFVQNENEQPVEENNEYLRLRDINAFDPQLVEFGFQSFDNKSFNHLTIDEINVDIIKSIDLLQSMEIPFQWCMAFSQGAFPSLNPIKRQRLFNALAKNKIALAFQNGNRLNELPLQNHFLIQRLPVSGTISLEKFGKLLQSCCRKGDDCCRTGCLAPVAGNWKPVTGSR